MHTRVILIAGAVGVAVVVLLVTLLAGPEAPQREGPVRTLGAIEPPAGPGTLPKLDGRGQRGTMRDGGTTPTGGTEHGRWLEQRGERFTVLEWSRITPLPDGVSDVVAPSLRDHFTPQRVLTMTADEGTVYAPENQPRRGEMRGNVVLTLYETNEDRPVDLRGTADIVVRVMLDAANFDLELGQVDSASVVRLTGPTVDFRGQGLSPNRTRHWAMGARRSPRRFTGCRWRCFRGRFRGFRGGCLGECFQRSAAGKCSDGRGGPGGDPR
jgi:hypothetical protein